MVSDKQHDFLQQIDKAAKILDLLGDFPHAFQVLQSILDDPDIDTYAAIKLETLSFLADMCWHMGKHQDARQYIEVSEQLDLSDVDPDLINSSLKKLRQIKGEIDKH
jgi:hypothetical protein